MKFSLILSVLVASLGLYLPVTAQANMLYTEQGYPYTPLVKRVEEVKIFYSEKQERVSCRAEINHAQQQWQSDWIEVKADDFAKRPLASCLPRKQAKRILASTY